MPTKAEAVGATTVYISTSWASDLGLSSASWADDRVVVRPRRSDWGMSRPRALLSKMLDSAEVAWRSRRFDVVIVCTASLEGFLVAALATFLARRSKVVLYDFLMPSSTCARRARSASLRRAAHICCIRRGDRSTLQRRYGIGLDRSSFVAFPWIASSFEEVADDGYVYAAGSAHRDWPTFFDAMAPLECGVVASVNAGVVPAVAATLGSRLSLHGPDAPLSPAAGRERAARASVIVVPLFETDLPAGPLVLLDAMAAGKAIVATDVNGSRDYLTNGVDALLVPPGDAAAMTEAVALLLGDAELRRRLGEAARARILREHRVESLAQSLEQVARSVAGDLSTR